MKSTELRKLVQEYKALKAKQAKTSKDLSEKLQALEHRYYHETGRTIKEP